MSPLTFPVAPSGLVVPVLVSLCGPDLAGLIAAGQPPPAPLLVRGLIDTGCDLTGISAILANRLGLKQLRQAKTHAAGGQMAVNVFEMSLSITDPAAVGAPMFVHPYLTVTELPYPPAGLDVLIGLDVILEGRLLIDGATRSFTLEF